MPSTQCSSNESSVDSQIAGQHSEFFGVSGSSSSVCVSPPGLADLPANLPAGTIRSRKYSWNASAHLAATAPFLRELLSWPWSERVRNVRSCAPPDPSQSFPACLREPSDSPIQAPEPAPPLPARRSVRVRARSLDRPGTAKLWTPAAETFQW